ncbi:MAG: hypothetical protein MJA30_27110 [Cytophagales bacterium]|nr:hypothetical protein [Cytophagales bacterium]
MKLQLLVRTLNVLGNMMASSWYHIGGKALGKLFGGNLLRNMKELMTLLGHLNFMGQFIPNYKRRVWLLQQLMKVMGGRWIEERTAKCVCVHFYGACQLEKGGGGIMVCSTSGDLLVASAVYYGNNAPTNNTVEA